MDYLSPYHIKKKKIFKPEPIRDQQAQQETEEGVVEVEEEYEKERQNIKKVMEELEMQERMRDADGSVKLK